MLLVLTCVAGLVEAISYLELGHVFTRGTSVGSNGRLSRPGSGRTGVDFLGGFGYD